MTLSPVLDYVAFSVAEAAGLLDIHRATLDGCEHREWPLTEEGAR